MSQTREQMLTLLGLAPDALEQAGQRQSTAGGSLRDNLMALDLLSDDQFAKLVSDRLRMPYANPKATAITDEALSLLPRGKAEKYLALPLVLDSKHRRLSIALARPTDMPALDELKFVIGHTLIPHYTPEDELTEAITREYARFEASQAAPAAWSPQAQAAGAPEFRFPIVDVTALASGDPIMRLLAAVFTEAQARQAGEIHLNPAGDGLRLAFRIHGQQTDIASFPAQLTAPLFTRLRRLLLGEPTDRSGLLQQGTALLKLPNKQECDLSYLFYPTVFQDQACLKLKNRHHLPVLDDLRLAPDSQAALRQALSDLQGIVLVAGTAKSGITTTLYTLLNTLNKPHLTLMSIENPVEMRIPGVTQGPVRDEAEQTYAAYLHYALHQRPDALMIDRVATPDMFQALAMLASGSLVLTSLPAFDAAGALIKLRLLTSPAFVASHVVCILAQRLVRVICDGCKEAIALPAQHRQKLGFGPDDQCYAGKGCARCNQTGYHGLTPIFEVMALADPSKQALTQADTAADARTLQAERQVASLRDDGMRKVKEGVTTIQEVLKATML